MLLLDSNQNRKKRVLHQNNIVIHNDEKSFFILGLLCDILWSDPDPEVLGWGPSDRGVSYVFGADVLGTFLSKMDLDLVVRGHQVSIEKFCSQTA